MLCTINAPETSDVKLRTVHNLQQQFKSDHHPVVSVLVGVVDECTAEHRHGTPLVLYSYRLSEHSLLSLLSLH